MILQLAQFKDKSGRCIEIKSDWYRIMCKRAVKAFKQFTVRKRVYDHFDKAKGMKINRIVFSKEYRQHMITVSNICQSYHDGMNYESVNHNNTKSDNYRIISQVDNCRKIDDDVGNYSSIKKCEIGYHIANQAVKRNAILQWVRAVQRHAYEQPSWSLAVTHFSSSGHFQRMSRALYRIQSMQKR